MPQECISDADIYQQLRLAIDNSDLNLIQKIFDDYPELDWNTITPNRLSALWWALTPPRGKSINQNIVSLLLSLERNNQRIINPTQLYINLRPKYYLKKFIDDTKLLRQEIKAAETAYANEFQNEIIQQENATQLAADTHSASNPFIVKASDVNLKRLYQRYKTRLNVESELEDIDKFITTQSFLKIFHLPMQQDFICNTLKQIKIDPTTRSDMTPDDGPCNLKEALALAWLASKETKTELVTDPNPLERQKMILDDLFEIHRVTSCWPGRWGRLGTALSNMHKDVYYQTGMQLTGELARDKFAALIGTIIANAYENDSEKYWSITRTRLGIGDDKTEQITKNWWQAELPALKAAMHNANIAVDEIDKLLNETTIETFSLSRHEPTRQLNLLLCFFQQKNKANFFEINYKNSINQTLESLKNTYIQQCLQLPDDISKLNLIPERTNQLKQWVLDTLLTRSHEDEEINLADLWAVIQTQLKISALNDGLLNWFNALDLNKQIEISKACLNKKTILSSDLIGLAITHSCMAGLSLKGMDLSNMDFRGFDLSNIDFSETDLRKANLGLIYANNTIWKGCNLADAEFNQFVFPEALIGSTHCTEELLRRRDIDGKNVFHHLADKGDINTVNAILSSPHCTEDLLMDEDCYEGWAVRGDTILHIAIENGRLDILKSILSSPACTKKVLLKYPLPLHTAIFKSRLDMVETILFSTHCTPEALGIQNPQNNAYATNVWDNLNRGHGSALHAVMELIRFDINNISIAKPILNSLLNSPHCTEKVLTAKEYPIGTALHAAIELAVENRSENTDLNQLVQAIINSPHCTSKVYAIQNREGQSVLQMAVKNNLPITSTLRAMREKHFLEISKVCDRDDITKQNILDIFEEMKKKNGIFADIHLQLNPKWDKFRLFFKRAANGEKNFWHTKNYQEMVKMLKNAYLKKGGDVEDKAKEKAFIDYTRGNSPLHLLPTSTRRRFK